jgi:hypothetical protein
VFDSLRFANFAMRVDISEPGVGVLCRMNRWDGDGRCVWLISTIRTQDSG